MTRSEAAKQRVERQRAAGQVVGRKPMGDVLRPLILAALASDPTLTNYRLSRLLRVDLQTIIKYRLS
jgi:hypothetical protein